MSLDDLYTDFILSHSNSSPHKGTLEDADLREEARNLSCGDELEIFMALDDGRISHVRFDGHGCAISVASASVMAQLLEGKEILRAREIVRSFLGLFSDDEVVDETLLDDAVVLKQVKRFPMRVKCVTLAWHAVEGMLKDLE
ncbi:MAG TPA: SUF system NifU family Fe-S cluster assembly protein [Kosmotogaceae bacterium]|nr:MAG: SUF system FeS assembly protein, NifU family [Thermotogales bacterium 46_20]HAA85944.1 SUF system NifU family Fe-S cluster assembly protein [Kosmotogaceae bacterium]